MEGYQSWPGEDAAETEAWQQWADFIGIKNGQCLMADFPDLVHQT